MNQKSFTVTYYYYKKKIVYKNDLHLLNKFLA